MPAGFRRRAFGVDAHPSAMVGLVASARPRSAGPGAPTCPNPVARSVGSPGLSLAAHRLAKRPTPELVDRVAALAPDVMVANIWRTRLPEELFSIPAHGTLNLHNSLLPKFTGFSPVIWSLISGASHTGLTAHLMDAELDIGAVLVQRAVEITPTSTGTSLVLDTLDLVPDVLEGRPGGTRVRDRRLRAAGSESAHVLPEVLGSRQHGRLDVARGRYRAVHPRVVRPVSPRLHLLSG